MRLGFVLALLAAPALAEEIHPDAELIFDCTLTRSCSDGGCGEEDVNARLTLTGAAAHYSDKYTEVDLTAEPDPVSGTITFASAPDITETGAMAHYATLFSEGALLLTVHNFTTDAPDSQAPVAITFDGMCEASQ